MIWTIISTLLGILGIIITTDYYQKKNGIIVIIGILLLTTQFVAGFDWSIGVSLFLSSGIALMVYEGKYKDPEKQAKHEEIQREATLSCGQVSDADIKAMRIASWVKYYTK